MLCPWGAVDTLVDSVSLNRSQHECSRIGPPLSRRNKYSYRSLCVLVSVCCVPIRITSHTCGLDSYSHYN